MTRAASPEAFRDSFEPPWIASATLVSAEKLQGHAAQVSARGASLVEPGGIERAIGKAKHVDDRREK